MDDALMDDALMDDGPSEECGAAERRATHWSALLRDAERHAAERPQGVAEHRPTAAMLACSDARMPPSVIFGRPAGDLFVVRIAGNTASDAAVASLEYAVSVLGVDTIVVLGHTECGAVAAALDGACEGSLAAVVEPICGLAAVTGCHDPGELSALNVASSMDRLIEASDAIAVACAAGRLSLHGAIYDLETGRLRPVPPFGASEPANPIEDPIEKV